MKRLLCSLRHCCQTDHKPVLNDWNRLCYFYKVWRGVRWLGLRGFFCTSVCKWWECILWSKSKKVYILFFPVQFFSPFIRCQSVTLHWLGFWFGLWLKHKGRRTLEKSHCWLTAEFWPLTNQMWRGFLLTHWKKTNFKVLRPFSELVKGTGDRFLLIY